MQYSRTGFVRTPRDLPRSIGGATSVLKAAPTIRGEPRSVAQYTASGGRRSIELSVFFFFVPGVWGGTRLHET